MGVLGIRGEKMRKNTNSYKMVVFDFFKEAMTVETESGRLMNLQTGVLKMPKKIKAYLDFESFDNFKCLNDLMFYIRGYFDKLAFKYRDMTISEIKSHLEDLKVVFEFLDKKGYEK